MILLDIMYGLGLLLQTTIDPGQAFDTLRQNNTVVGLLYILVVAEAGVIVKLWLKAEKINEARLTDLKERLKVEEELMKKIEKLEDSYNRKD